MQKVTMFTMAGCPYCRAAHRWMEELMQEYPEYNDIELEIIDETEHPDIADRYDYYYVPTYYVGRDKVHEGVATKEKVHRVLERALRERNPPMEEDFPSIGGFCACRNQARSSVACLTKAFSTSSRVAQ